EGAVLRLQRTVLEFRIALVHGASAHGGTMANGRGATFRVRIPTLRGDSAVDRTLVERTSNMPEGTYDLIVLGSGTGGYAVALRAAELGKKVALVERDERLGGTCLLRGCIPSKALLESASVMDHVNRSEEWGIKASGEPDWPKVLETKAHIVDKKVSGLTSLIKARKIEVVTGTGRLAAGPA